MTESELENTGQVTATVARHIEPTTDVLKGLDKIFAKFSFVSQRSKLSPEVFAQQKQADMFLDSKLWEPYFKMLENGYVPTKKQEKFWDKKLSLYISAWDRLSKVQYTKQVDRLSTINQHGIPIQQHHYIDILLGSLNQDVFKRVKTYIEENNLANEQSAYLFDCSLDFSKISKREPFIEKLLTLAQTQDFSTALYTKLTKHMKNLTKLDLREPDDRPSWHNLYAATDTIKTIPNILFKGIELDQFLTVLQKWEKARHGSDRSNFDVAFKEVVENYYSKALDKKIETTQQIFSDSYFKKVTSDALQNMESHFSIQTLPLEAKETLKRIQKQYDNVNTYQLKLSEEDKFTMQNLLEKRIPEVLEKFLTIPPDYRTGLTNIEGKNAQDLMLESLANFNTKITSIVENIAQSKIQDLSATKRYSKSI